MRKSFAIGVIGAVVLLASPLALAEAARPISLVLPGAGADSDGAVRVDEELLFYSPAFGLPAGPHTLEVAVFVAGEVAYRERLSAVVEEVAGPRAALPVFELFAWSPQWSAALTALSEDAQGEMVVALALDGGTAESFTSLQLRELSRGLRAAAGVMPLTATSELLFGGREPEGEGLASIFAAVKDAACVSQCQAARDSCYDSCGVPEVPMCLEYCESEYSACYNSCPSQCTGPTVTTWATITPVSVVQYLGPPRCLLFGPVRYYPARMYEKITAYRKTTQCNGSSVTEVTSVQYRYNDCWLRTGEYCSPAVGYSYNYYTCPY